MDNKIRDFLSQDLYLACDNCNNQIKATLKNIGEFLTCPKCGRKILISKTINYEDDVANLKVAVDEYLKKQSP